MTFENEALNEEAAKERDRQRQIVLSAISAVIATPEGKTVIRHILAAADIYNAPFVDSDAMFYGNGQRNLGMFVLRECMVANPEHAAKALIQLTPHENK